VTKKLVEFRFPIDEYAVVKFQYSGDEKEVHDAFKLAFKQGIEEILNNFDMNEVLDGYDILDDILKSIDKHMSDKYKFEKTAYIDYESMEDILCGIPDVSQIKRDIELKFEKIDDKISTCFF
jgi:hypothetical protein